MKIYVSGPVSDTVTVRRVQSAVVAAGHELTLDWSADVSFAENYASQAERSARWLRRSWLRCLRPTPSSSWPRNTTAEGMFVELGAALTRASRGELDHVVLLGEIHHERVFYFHPLVRRAPAVEDWLAQLQ